MIPAVEFIRPVIRKVAALPGRFIPYPAQKRVLSLVLNEAFRSALVHGDMDFLNGAKIRIKVVDLAVDWLLQVDVDRFSPISRQIREDVCISGDSLDFLLLATRLADPDTLFFQRRIRIEGDTEIGLGIKNTMDSMDWDDLPSPLRKLLQAASSGQRTVAFAKWLSANDRSAAAIS
jgi:predicted lipid carrier protein YhbT